MTTVLFSVEWCRARRKHAQLASSRGIGRWESLDEADNLQVKRRDDNNESKGVIQAVRFIMIDDIQEDTHINTRN